MPGAATADVKLGFYVGIGVLIAMALWGMIQMLLGKAVNRGGG